MTIIQSVLYRDRSFSRGRTLLVWPQRHEEEQNGISDYPPDLMTVGVIALGRKSFSDWICLRSHWTQDGHAVPVIGSVCPEITTSRHSNQDFILEFTIRIFFEIHLKGSSIEPPKYSCRDCWTGGYPMKNDQSKPDTKPLWGLKSKPLTHKPKEERILDTVNRVISRIQNDERNCLWPNTPTRLA